MADNPHLSKALDSIRLSRRVLNALRAVGINTVRDLVKLRAEDILKLPAAGKKALLDVRGALAEVGLKLSSDGSNADGAAPVADPSVEDKSALDLDINSLGLTLRTANALRAAGLRSIRDLVSLRTKDIRKMRAAGKKALWEIREALVDAGLGLADQADKRDEQKQLDLINAQPLTACERTLIEASQATSLEKELSVFLRSVTGSDRNVEIVMKLMGWKGGQPPRTLESVGREFGVTRERVRQIGQQAERRLEEFRGKATFVQRTIAGLMDQLPATSADLRLTPLKLGLADGPFDMEGLRLAANTLGLEWPFEVVDLGGGPILVSADSHEVYPRAMGVIRRKTSERGCLSVVALMSELGLKDEDKSRVVKALSSSLEIEWLDHEKEWLYSGASARNRLLNICSKVLGVAPTIRVAELRRAVSKSRRLAMCPPQRILAAFVVRVGLAQIEGDVVRADLSKVQAPSSTSAEGIMIRVLDEKGPALDGEVFVEHCIAAGMNAITFYIYRIASPVIATLGKNVYCKVGAQVPTGIVEEIVSNRRSEPRAAEHGWTKSGGLWFGRELSRQVIVAGGIPVPGFVSELVQGDWAVLLPDNSSFGSVTCRNTFISSFRKVFEALGAEPGDCATYEFDLRRKSVMVRIGGLDLMDAMQDSAAGERDIDAGDD